MNGFQFTGKGLFVFQNIFPQYLPWLASRARLFLSFSISTFFVFSFNLDLADVNRVNSRGYWSWIYSHTKYELRAIMGDLTSCFPVGFYDCASPEHLSQWKMEKLFIHSESSMQVEILNAWILNLILQQRKLATPEPEMTRMEPLTLRNFLPTNLVRQVQTCPS